MSNQIKKVKQKSIFFKTYLLGFFTSTFLIPLLVLAQKKYSQDIFGIFEYTKDIIDDLVLWLFTTGAVMMFIGYLAYKIYGISQGESPKGVSRFVLWGLIALTLMFTFYAVSSLIAVTFGIQIGIPQFFQNQDMLSPGSGRVQSRSIIGN
jgi:membrane protease YdiL (CAAX protease family)